MAINRFFVPLRPGIMMASKNIEITAPVGSFESLAAAIQAETDSVYFGIGNLNMRSRSSVNFTHDDLVEISQRCRENGISSYITLNSVIFDKEVDDMKKIVDAAKGNGITAIIAFDPAVIAYASSIGMPLHMSTQTNITNLESVRYYAHFADVMVLARELSLDQVTAITRSIEEQQITGPSGKLVRIEVFAHGALCMAISGKCYLSLDNYNASANRGACYQQCRHPYKVTDMDSGIELMIDHEYILSPKDLCTIGFVDKIIAAGVKVLKIEGRGRSPEYVKTVVKCYREAVDAIRDGTYSAEKVDAWMKRLETVYNRGFWDGYYLGRKLGEWSDQYGSKATQKKIYAGKVTNYFTKLKVVEIKMESGKLSVGDNILFTGPTTGVIEDTIREIRVDLKPVENIKKGELCSIPVNELIRRGDKVYKIVLTEEN